VALTPAQIDALPDYTNAQMVKLHRSALVDLAGAGPDGSVAVAGRQYTLRDTDQLRASLRYFEDLARADAEAAAIANGDPAAGGCLISRFGEPTA